MVQIGEEARCTEMTFALQKQDKEQGQDLLGNPDCFLHYAVSITEKCFFSVPVTRPVPFIHQHLYQ